MDAGPHLKLGTKARFTICLDQHDVMATDIIAACVETYEVGPAAAAPGPTATTSISPAANNSSIDFAELASLAWRVQNSQRNSTDASRAWTAPCANYNGVKDPYRHNLTSQRLFLAAVNADMV